MVCNRCIMVVKQELEKLNLTSNSIVLGEIELQKTATEMQLAQLKENLARLGFELLDSSQQKLIEKIKNTIIEQVHYNEFDSRHNFSDILSKKINKDYSYLSNLFSEVEGITIEKYIINQKIEKTKGLIIYNELNLSGIALQLGHSSVAHLSAQFKKVTELTPSHFKKAGGAHRKSIDAI